MTKQRPKILFPTDFESHSRAAFRHAIRLAADTNCQLIALHVANQPDMGGSRWQRPTYHEDLRQRLAKFDSEMVPIEHRLRIADPGPEICRMAEQEHCRLIFMGITNKLGFDRLGLGGVHDYVLRHASCPVATLRQQPASRPEGQLGDSAASHFPSPR